MEEARPEPEAGRDLAGIADHRADILQHIMIVLVALQVGQEPAIVIGLKLREMGCEVFNDRAGTADSAFALLSEKNCKATLMQHRPFRRQFPGLLIEAGELERLLFARFDVGLVEWI